MTHKINHANIKEWAKNYTGEPFDAILCDPPYELGFMGKSWDSSGIAFDRDMWADLFRHIKPGGHLLAFSGSRTYHRMAVAIEDAGFEIRDMIEWVYGSGFPKSLNIGKAVDKIQGNMREVTGDNSNFRPVSGKEGYLGQSNFRQTDGMSIQTKGTSPYEGYGTALKPAHEPCVLARKPLEKGMTVATNALKHGTGGLNIDGSRVESTEFSKDIGTKRPQSDDYVFKSFDDKTRPSGSGASFELGRFPANLIHDGSDEVVGLFPDTKSGVMKGKQGGFGNSDLVFGNNSQVPEAISFGDSGSAARFFYTAKASKSERNAGLEDMPLMPLAHSNQAKAELKRGNTDFAREIDTSSFNSVKMLKNHHPTVKPLSLTKYLATLIKPPTSGRLLVPFSGSGSEMIGALQAGWEYVEGVELTEEYIPIAEARIKYWTDKISSEQTELL